jgi:hypothetical protein
MTLFNFFFISLPLLAGLHGVFSIIAKMILKKNGYKINYLITEFFYETRVLKEICVKQSSLKPLLVVYYVVSISLIVEFIIFMILFFLGVF